MPSIRSTNVRRRRIQRRRLRLAALERSTGEGPADCGQCEGTGTIEGGLSGDGPDEECPICDGSGILPDDE